MQEDRGFTRELVAQVEEAGYRALCLTVDTPVFGARLRELKARFALPPGLERENLAALSSEAATTGHRPLARGAAAVLVGRPILYGLAVGGAAGVARVLNILTSELRMAMALTGRRTVAEVDQEVLWDRA